VASRSRSWREDYPVLAAAGVVASAVAVTLAWPTPRMATLLSVIACFGPAMAFPSTRRWSLWVTATAFLLAAVGAAWLWLRLSLAELPLAYAGVAALLWGALTPLRRDRAAGRDRAVALLSWAPWAVTIVTAVALLARRGVLEQEAGPSIALAKSAEWSVLALAVAVAAVALGAEGLRLRNRALAVAGSGVLVPAILLAVATLQPANVQAYTSPVGLYLVGLGLGFRRSSRAPGVHMYDHEALLALGLAFLVLPPSKQAFESGNNPYIFELVAEGIVFLILGLVLSARWLVAGGVLAFTVVALRGLTLFGTKVPFWLTLAVTGMVSVGLGILLLLERERWERACRWIGDWWLQEPARRGSK
jgi:hypothetical protein